MKIYINNPRESWVVDRFRKEFIKTNPDAITDNIANCDVIWVIAPWQWTALPEKYLRSKFVVCSIHHIVPEKFGPTNRNEFLFRDKYVDAYHVPCLQTEIQLKRELFPVLLKNKKMLTHPFWTNSDLWRPIDSKRSLRDKYGLPRSAKLIGSFQRDTEGHDLKSPKLEKGPDSCCDIVERVHAQDKDVEVLLAGWRRQYVMSRLNATGIKYHYIELPPFEAVNELYNCLDLYVVASRYEGGPQAIFECALTKTPIISTDVGAARYILADESIYSPGKDNLAKPNVGFAYNRVKQYDLSHGMNIFLSTFREFSEGS